MAKFSAQDSEQLADLNCPVGQAGSGGRRYAAAMYFYRTMRMTPELLEIYRRCCKFDDEDPIDLARFEGVSVPAVFDAHAHD